MYNLLIYKPLFNLLLFFYNTVSFGDLGVAIILLTLVIRLILYPLFQKSVRHQTVMQKLQPEIKKIQERHSGNRQIQGEAMMALYKEHRANPFSGILMLIVQLPILFALFSIFRNILEPITKDAVYAFVSIPGVINTHFLGLIPLEQPSIMIAVLAALGQYFQVRLGLPKYEKGAVLTSAERMGKQMAIIGPVLTISILWNFPSALGLYWLTTSLFSIVQQQIVNRELRHDTVGRIHNEHNDARGVHRLEG